MPTPLEERLHSLAPLMPEPQAPGSGGEERSGKLVSLLYPTPDITGDMTKWDLAQKNLLARLDEAGGIDAVPLRKLKTYIEEMDQNNLPDGGFALFANDGEMAVFGLSVRPAPMLCKGSVLAMPALVDAASKLRYWVVVLDAEAPRLFHVSGRIWTDRTPGEVMTLTGQMQEYHPMAAVHFHSSGRPFIGHSRHASSMFHALGTATEDYKRDIIERVLADFARKVHGVVGGLEEPVMIVGDPKNTGLFKQTFEHKHLAPDLQVGGDALELKELAQRAHEAMAQADENRRREEMDALDPNTLDTELQTLLKAAIEGRVDAVYLREDAACLLPGEDERLKLGAIEDEDALLRSDIVAQAVKNGASLHLFTQEMAPKLPEIAATMRY